MIPTAFIEELKQNLRIEKLIAEYTELKDVGAGLKGTCPFHHDNNSLIYLLPNRSLNASTVGVVTTPLNSS